MADITGSRGEVARAPRSGGRVQAVSRAAVVWRGEAEVSGGRDRGLAIPLAWGYKDWADACLDKVHRDRSREREIMGKTLNNLPFTIRQMAGLNIQAVTPQHGRRSGKSWRNRYENAVSMPTDSGPALPRIGHAPSSSCTSTLGPALSQGVLQRFGQPYSGVQFSRQADSSRVRETRPQGLVTFSLGSGGRARRSEGAENVGKVGKPRVYAFRSPNDVFLHPAKNLGVVGMKMKDAVKERKSSPKRVFSREKPPDPPRAPSPVVLVVPCPSPYLSSSPSPPPSPSTPPYPWNRDISFAYAIRSEMEERRGQENHGEVELLASNVLAVHRLRDQGEGARTPPEFSVPSARNPQSSVSLELLAILSVEQHNQPAKVESFREDLA